MANKDGRRPMKEHGIDNKMGMVACAHCWLEIGGRIDAERGQAPLPNPLSSGGFSLSQFARVRGCS